MAKTTTAKPLTGTLPNPPSDEDLANAPGSAMVALTEREIDAAILASAGEGISVDIAGDILRGTTIDEILGGADPTESLVGVVFKPMSWKWGRSSYPTASKKPGAFVILKVVDGNGRERTVTSGAPNIMAALRAFEKTDGLDIPALTVREHATSNGFSTFRFHKAQAA